MDQLVERVLTVGTRFTPVNRPRLIIDCRTVECYMLTVTLHRELLEIGRESLQVLLVGQYGYRISTKKIVVPHRQQRNQHGQISLKRRGAEMLVHFVEAFEHFAKALWSNC